MILISAWQGSPSTQYFKYRAIIITYGNPFYNPQYILQKHLQQTRYCSGQSRALAARLQENVIQVAVWALHSVPVGPEQAPPALRTAKRICMPKLQVTGHGVNSNVIIIKSL